MAQPTIDPRTFGELKETAGADFAFELVDTFLTEAPGMLGDLRAALATGNADNFRRAAHSLKSNSNTFGALTLAAMAKELELTGLAPALAAGGSTLDALEQEYGRVAAALKELKDG
jgi:HPt (histidine-containing phosphotransfer) domain-containing protein